ncbi:MAG: type II toxin-antitoxin system RelE/ParE family toxin [Bacteroidota bacterium]
MFEYFFTAAAEKDLEEAFLWYEDQLAGLGEELLEDVEIACQTISKHPNRYPKVVNENRRILLKAIGSKFSSYSLVYKVQKVRNRIIILAVVHASQSPTKWENRE